MLQNTQDIGSASTQFIEINSSINPGEIRPIKTLNIRSIKTGGGYQLDTYVVF